ncbi:ABC transporter permease [Agromyces albus]|uniref:ABC transporter permease n=1 Tax=Agromyces albus TaxID=205332 RepID=UPI002780EE41|nr:ABC transporter permease [Agromyces albus]MDQ0574625.1 ABC-type multidrug transport system permease subunit [Agromyces albus]
MSQTAPAGGGGAKGRLQAGPTDAAAGGTARALAAARMPRRWGAWYVALHRFRVMKSYTGTVVVAGIGNPLIYLYALGVGLATIVDANVGDQAVGGVSYLVFVAPALLASAAITVSSEEFTYPIMLGYKWNPTFTGMSASPLRPTQIVDGVVISVSIRMLVNLVLFFLLIVVFGAAPSPAAFLMIFGGLLGGLAFGAVLMAYTSTLEEDTGQLAMVMRFIVLPMTLFSGTFFPLSIFPIWLQWIGWISPLWHSTELARVFSYGYGEPIWLTIVHVAYLVALTVVGWVWARRIAIRRLGR